MANRYIYSGAAGAGTGADWANAHVTLAAAIAAGAAGDVFYVAHDHSHNYGANQTLAFPGTAAAPNRVLCVNRAGSVPPVAADLTTGAVEGTNAALTTLSVNGTIYCYGMTFAPGSGQSSGCNLNLVNGSNSQVYESCLLSLLSTGSTSRISPAGVNATIKAEYRNCQVKFASTGHRISFDGGTIIWHGNAQSVLASGSSVPDTLGIYGAIQPRVHILGTDLSSISGTLLATQAGIAPFRFSYCKLHASVTIVGATPTSSQLGGVEVVGCHSSSDVARNERYLYQGTLTTERTIVRTGGASDGTTTYSWRIVPTANNERDLPFETFEGAVWNEAVGASKTLTVHTVTDNVTLTDAEIWLEVEYLGSSGSPVASLVSDGPATVLTTATNQSTSSETWVTTGLGTPVKQQLSVSFTPQMAGPIRWRVKYARTSTTVYVCPKAELS